VSVSNFLRVANEGHGRLIDTMSIKSLNAGVEQIRTGLIGRGIRASRSPWMHEEEGRAQGLSLSYTLFDFDLSGLADDQLADQLKALQAEGYAGVNITHPFKQSIIPLLDELAPSAELVGAVNTVQFIAGKSIGHNTDMSGFAQSVRVGLAGQSLSNVVQFGAGGAGSATAQALLTLGTEKLTLVEENEARSAQLAARLVRSFPSVEINCAGPASVDLESAHGVVNATPVGMATHPGMPFDPARLGPGTWVADIVYFPLETALLKHARAQGCPTLDGRGMAAFQAADAFAIMTSFEADRDRILASFDAFADRKS
jgi:shikimate dehydrogenase